MNDDREKAFVDHIMQPRQLPRITLDEAIQALQAYATPTYREEPFVFQIERENEQTHIRYKMDIPFEDICQLTVNSLIYAEKCSLLIARMKEHNMQDLYRLLMNEELK